ncbi:MAG: septum site-determining protein MinC [Gammaproteobacteria bacterium]|nr:septum site-determining protein MinC [Gammaproteobacteria bacterium]
MNDTKANLKAFQLKGSVLTITVLELLKADMSAIRSQFLSLVKQTPDLFRGMPLIIDLKKIQSVTTPLDYPIIFELLREHGLVPVGIRGGNPEQQEAVKTFGLPLLAATRGERTSKVDSVVSEESSGTRNVTTKLVTQQVRSGQQIYARGGDLVILNSVSPGAEVLADGNIHIYGSLRGRALAGVNGDKHARIFCKQIDAELVSIAGHYWVNEDLAPMPDGQTIQIYLDEERLHMGTF